MEVGRLPVFLIHYGAPGWLRQATESILRSDIAVDITVINNGPFGIPLILDPRVQVLDSDDNLGYAGGANVGIRIWLEGNSPYCVVGPHDLVVEPTTLSLLVQAGDAYPNYGIIGPSVSTNEIGETLSANGDLLERTTASGLCLLLRRSCIQAIGGFDEDFHTYTEDRELGLRARRFGWKVGLVQTARAGGLGTRASVERWALIVANHILLAAKTDGRWAVVRCATIFLMRGLWSSAIGCLLLHRGAYRRHWGSLHLRGVFNGLRKIRRSRAW